MMILLPTEPFSDRVVRMFDTAPRPLAGVDTAVDHLLALTHAHNPWSSASPAELMTTLERLNQAANLVTAVEQSLLAHAIEADTFAAMDQLRALGEDVWFNLGDRDLAIGLHRAMRLAGGARLTQTIDDLRRAFGVAARVLVPTDDPLRTWITAGGRARAFQEFMIRDRARGPIEDVEYRGEAMPAPEAVSSEASDAEKERIARSSVASRKARENRLCADMATGFPGCGT